MKVPAAVVAILVVSTAAGQASSAAYERDVTAWRSDREARLKAENGWLTVVALHWLKEGENRVGAEPGLEVPLPAPAPKRVGVITLKNGVARFTPSGAAALTRGKPAGPMNLKPDTGPDYDTLDIGPIRFFVIQRENRFGVRVKDNQSEARRTFRGLKWYPVDRSWRIRAKFVPWDKTRTLTFDTEIGTKEQEPSPGYVVFQRGGKEYRLEPVVEEDHLWFVLRDQTSGKSTYAASRFLYVPMPKDGYVDLDFNKAENPPCVFTAFATCPLPPPQNRLTLPVTAGELMYAH